MIELRKAYEEFWSELNVKEDYQQSFSKIDEMYPAENVGYHNKLHVKDCIAKIRDPKVRSLLKMPLASEGALWFHDIIYDSRSKYNELKSANIAVEVFTEAGLPDDFTYKAADLIHLTRHSFVRSPLDIDSMAVLDIDLSILGEDEETFDKYEEGIKHEYVEKGSIPLSMFRAGRADFLEKKILARAVTGTIYQTELFRERYEEQAKKNLRRSIAQLRKPI